MQTDELAKYLASLQREDCYQVERVLKESAHEVTQLVRFTGTNGAASEPLIRKYIKKEPGLGTGYLRLFNAQQSGQRFKHVPRIFECYDHDENLVVIMEYVNGETVHDHVSRHSPSLQVALDVFPRACDAATELHEDFDPPIIHRDLKPSNIILTGKGLVVIDFGIAREFRTGAQADTARFGTRAFAPPEQFGFGQTTVRSDVYALGMLLYFCLTGNIPDASALETAFADPRIPPAVRDVIAQATAFDPAERFSSARALKAAFLNATREPAVLHPATGATAGASARVVSNAGAAAGAAPAAAPAEAPVAAPVATSVAAPVATSVAAPVNAMPSAASTFEPQQSSPFGKQAIRADKTSVIGLIRNGILITLLVLGLIGCFGAFFNPGPTIADKPLWYNVVGYLLLLPALFISIALMACDKTYLRKRFRLIAAMETRHWVIFFFICLAVTFVTLGIMGMLAPSG